MYHVDTPFDIPDSWEWVRFKDLVDYSMGKTPPQKETEYWSDATLPWVSIADLAADGTVTITKECVNHYAAEHTFKGKISKAGTLLMSFKLTVGKVSVLGIDAFHSEAIISIYPSKSDRQSLPGTPQSPALCREWTLRYGIRPRHGNSFPAD